MKGNLVKIWLMLVGSLLLVTIALASGHPGTNEAPEVKYETRCGWFSNPTPANASLFDREREWIIGVQGGRQADGDWPDFGPRQWVKTNVNYGYGCACLRMRVDHKTHEISEIKSAKVRSLAVCRRDRSLRKWGFK